MKSSNKCGDVSTVTIAFWLVIFLFIAGLVIALRQFDTFKSLINP